MIIGEKFNKLTVLDKTDKRTKEGSIIYKCKCECGNITFATSRDLKSGHKKSCGCIKTKNFKAEKKDLTGKKFGKLTAIKCIGKGTDRSYLWECKCDCGKTINVLATSLLSGNTKSCGCISKENIIKESKKNNIDNTNVSIINGLLKDSTSKITKSGVKGVGWDKRRKKWRAYIGFKNKSYHLGYFDSKEDAIKVRKTAEKKLFGEFLEWYKENIKGGK